MIPVNEPRIGKREIEYVLDCLNTGWISSAGKYIQEFEEKWAAYCGMNYGIAVSNGTAALETAVACIELNPGDEVIMPAFTIISCALAVIRNKGVPVLVDSDPRTWCMNVTQIEEKITPKTKAIMPVHIYGHPVDMDPIFELSQKYNLKIIEDAAEAHGAEYKGKKCGSLGDISCFSFYANKIITSGEGGMLLTNNEEYAEKARSYRNLCFRRDRRFFHTELGHNFRLTNLQAAIGLGQLERINELIDKKRWIGHTYNEGLKNIPGLNLPVEESWAKNVYWMYGIVLNENVGMNAARFAQDLLKEEIVTRPFFVGMHKQPILNQMGLFADEHFPIADWLANQGLYLPSGITLKEEQIEKICNVVTNLCKG